MFLRQYLHTDPPGGVSYLLGCAGHGSAVVVDPVESIETYLEDATSLGVSIDYVIDTHVHADHISGGRALADVTGATYVLHESAGARWPHRPVRDGEVVEAGNVAMRVLHTPGHTPEHISLLVTDRARGDEPWLLLTGHTLMVGDMGRTELATDAEVGARALFRTAERLRGLPDHVEVLPGAYAGSVCGRGLSGKPVSTIGFERRFNRAFALRDEEEFVRLMQRDVPAPPPRAAEIRALNLGVADLAGVARR